MTSYIGTYGEKALHRELKWQLEPTGEYHEVQVGKYIADIKIGAEITEIQTKSFHKIRDKLDAFLPDHKVTIVYPLAHEKLLLWSDGPGGDVIRERRSPRRGSFYDAFWELYQIRGRLTDANLRLRLMLLNVNERRAPNDRRRKKYTIIETELRSFYDELVLNSAEDYQQLIPDGLGEHFTTKDFSAASGINIRNSCLALNVLNHVGAIVRIGKQGRQYLYEKAQL